MSRAGYGGFSFAMMLRSGKRGRDAVLGNAPRPSSPGHRPRPPPRRRPSAPNEARYPCRVAAEVRGQPRRVQRRPLRIREPGQPRLSSPTPDKPSVSFISSTVPPCGVPRRFSNVFGTVSSVRGVDCSAAPAPGSSPARRGGPGRPPRPARAAPRPRSAVSPISPSPRCASGRLRGSRSPIPTPSPLPSSGGSTSARSSCRCRRPAW
jgi:hypothetical protein